jgi:hypothetical protein
MDYLARIAPEIFRRRAADPRHDAKINAAAGK